MLGGLLPPGGEACAFAGPCCYPDPYQAPDANPNRFYAYGVIARLALLAAARESKEAAQAQETDGRRVANP